MEIVELQKLYGQHAQTKALNALLSDNLRQTVYLNNLCASSAPLLFASLISSSTTLGNRPFLFILDDKEEAGYFYHDLVQLMGDDKVSFFPSSYRRAAKYGQRDAANEILRTEVLSKLAREEFPQLIVTYPEAIAEKVVAKDELVGKTIQLHTNERVDPQFIAETLLAYGFEREDYVYEPGQFAVRGSIIDVFSFSSEYPYRIDFFGDEVDTIRTFDVQTQLSQERVHVVSIVPELEEKSKENRVPFFHFLPSHSVVVLKDPMFIREQMDRVFRDGFSSMALAAQSATSELHEQELHEQLAVDSQLLEGIHFTRALLDFTRVEIGSKPSGNPDATITLDITPQPLFHKNFEMVISAFTHYLEQGYTIYILADSSKQTDRLASIFSEMGTGIQFKAVSRTLHAGFADNTIKCCFFTDHQIFDRFHKYNLRADKARSGKVALTLKELSQFQIGDYVVHIDHGIGRFAGLIRIQNGDNWQEVMKITYKNEDTAFVSIHSLHKVSKYKSRDAEAPSLSNLGSGAWERLKERTKSKIKDIARDLIKLYAQRKQEKGYAFAADTFMQHELEASFLYEDTPDQLKTTQDVKADMERDRPMDRLVCGDVGFGKTEVAIRAAFKAACDNKQVAVLVPTTVLAYQHHRTFAKRLKNFPVKVDYLSRARGATKAKEVLQGLADGTIHIVIGTHKLIGKNVKFKDLGLLIVDEEQKFGVSTKEKLRQLKTNVDTLTMTATPIPRTLQFSLMGARDLSAIQTPPPNRYPIQTEVHTFSPDIITDAINFEMSRNGQVFFVNNRISNLAELEILIKTAIPDARICIGHGQMPPEQLEKIIFDFINYDYDVLLSTTIIESGIDIPNANTILINNAQNFGLSDLHQMRGRVGRSNKKAFCYLLAPPLSSLAVEARRRLQAIENFSGLGSGIHIAMQDLDIRGAGNMLGAEQSGFITDLGYETYQKILSEAIKELKNDEFGALYADETDQKSESDGSLFVDDCAVDSDLHIYFPDEYIPSSSERMLLYRELDGLASPEEIEAFRIRLKDRFGVIPEVGEELIRLVALRQLAKKLGIEKIFLKGGKMILYFVNNNASAYFQSSSFGKCIEYMMMDVRRCSLDESKGHKRMIIREIESVREALSTLKTITSITQ